MKKIYCLLLLLIGCNACVRESNIMDLSGQWEVQIDSVHRYPVFLPGSLAENGVGEPVKDSIIYKLSEPVQYAGAAAYTKDIEIPLSWAGMPLQLYMERTKISEVYVNDSLLGIQRSVSAPHVYLIEKGLKAGINRQKPASPRRFSCRFGTYADQLERNSRRFLPEMPESRQYRKVAH